MDDDFQVGVYPRPALITDHVFRSWAHTGHGQRPGCSFRGTCLRPRSEHERAVSGKFQGRPAAGLPRE